MPYKLRGYSPDEVPLKEEALRRGLEFSDKIEKTWKEGPVYYNIIQTYTTWQGKDFWAARVSYNPDLSYEDMKATVLENHTAHEAQYIDLIHSFEELTVPNPLVGWYSALIRYRLPFPLNDRDMAIWLASTEVRPGLFIVFTLPRAMQTKHTRGYYMSVEVVSQMENGVKWIMAQTSDVGGWVPRWMQNPAITATIAQDVQLFKSWLIQHKRTSSKLDLGEDTHSGAAFVK